MSPDQDSSPDKGTNVDVDPNVDTEIESDAETDIGTANTMHGRSSESRIKLWSTLNGNRLLITGLLAIGFFVSFVVVGEWFVPNFESTLYRNSMIEYLFSTMISAIITGTTLVVTITQLVISQENGPLGDQRQRMSATMDFREYTEEMVGSPTPADPSAFLREIISLSERQAKLLRGSVAENADDRLKADIDGFTESVIGNAKEVRDQLRGGSFGTFGVLNAALNYNYGVKIFHIERIANDHPDSLTDEDTALLEDLKTTLSMFGAAREHVKTLYFEWALISLSQYILYTAVPALLVAGSMLVFYSGTSFLNTTFGVNNSILIIGAAFTITLLPFFLLISFIARVATAAKRTLAIGPLILRESAR